MAKQLIDVAQLRRLIRSEIRSAMGGARRGQILEYSVSGGRPYVTLEGYGEEVVEAQLTEAFGLASRPPTGTGLVAVRSGSQHVVVGAEDRSHRPSPGDGEVVLYNAHGQKVDLQGSAVVINDGARHVARNGDACSHALTVTIGPTTYDVEGTISVAGGTSEVLVP